MMDLERETHVVLDMAKMDLALEMHGFGETEIIFNGLFFFPGDKELEGDITISVPQSIAREVYRYISGEYDQPLHVTFVNHNQLMKGRKK